MPGVKKPAMSRQERAALTRSRMLGAAYDLFCEQGFRATTMDSIAERAGVEQRSETCNRCCHMRNDT